MDFISLNKGKDRVRFASAQMLKRPAPHRKTGAKSGADRITVAG
jgi:hypothetical protein